MFIDVTRYGGLRALRLAVSAIAYTDVTEDGCAIRLLGGESLRVNEDRETIERRIDAALGFATLLTAHRPELIETPIAASRDAGGRVRGKKA